MRSLLAILALTSTCFAQTLPPIYSGLHKPNCSAIAIEQTSPEVGDTLTVDSTWTGHPFEVKTEWYVNSVLAYTGESFNTTSVTEADDVVYVTESGLNAAGGATRTSASVTMLEGDDPPPLVAPTNTVAPVITGTATPGYTLTCSTGSWTYSPTSYSYQWTADNSDISGATSSTYVVQAGDVGKAIRCEVAATNAAGTGDPATSSNAKTIATAITIDSTWLTTNGPSPYYLNQQGKTYVLDTDVTTDGTAFAIIAKDVTFDLNGHTITYNNAAPITIPNGSFETGKEGDATEADGWDFTEAPNASRHEGVWLYNETYDGDYSLKFSDTTADEYVESTGTVTLLANTTYSLSAMFEYGGQGNASNPGVKAYVRLIGTGGETTREVSRSTGNNRGIQFQEGVFTTGATAETYTIQVGIEGHESSSVPFYIDDIKIQKTYNYGVVVGPQSWGPGYLPDISEYGSGINATIKNGTITQGMNGGTWNHGVFNHSSDGVVVDNTNITIHGANSSAIIGYDIATKTTTITNNTFTSNVQTITNRDAFDGAIVGAVAGIISNNTVTNGPHAGFFLSGSIPSIVSGNTIQLKAKYTNAFAIVGGGPGAQIFDNIISNGTGEYTSRGIMVTSGTTEKPTRVYNNTIAVQNFANSQEYEGNIIGGTYGIQVENVSYAEIFGNDVTVYGTTKGFAMRFTDISNNVSVHDNTFRAIATSGNAAPLSLLATTGSSIMFEDNTLITNDGIVGDISTAMDFALVRTTFKVDDAISSPLRFKYGYASGSGVHSQLRFIDTTFVDATSQAYLEDATVYNANPTESNRVQIAMEWTTTLQVKDANNNPLSGASVTIKDKDNNTVFTGTTNGSGQVVAVLKQQQVQGNTKTTYNDYTVTVTADGHTFEPVVFTADETQTVEATAE